MPLQPSETLIVLEKVSLSYNERVVLHGIDFVVSQGDFVVITGPNGGGKTTFLHLLLGLLQPTWGKIFIAPNSLRKEIGFVPQRFPFDTKFPISVLEVVLMGALSKITWMGQTRKIDRLRAKELLKLLGLLSLQHRPFGSLSGGQIQRVLIARALLGNPKILLLDEPTANVDLPSGDTIKSLLKNLKNDLTIVHVTHNLDDIMNGAQRFFCINKTLTVYTPKDICSHFIQGLYHKSYLPNPPPK